MKETRSVRPQVNVKHINKRKINCKQVTVSIHASTNRTGILFTLSSLYALLCLITMSPWVLSVRTLAALRSCSPGLRSRRVLLCRETKTGVPDAPPLSTTQTRRM
ncbi:hypothetical protein OE88DRAFT_322957 [Heliocybe sulcata]|uniref:Uncharacterized protein n=1 Tax=Heliocybe sulcata TaxID=5364 RepID=A0A5C3MY79_9AGAM|nr:hypothetical protein OE88DRAFT_322957 [Heliocybe sulcata]